MPYVITWNSDLKDVRVYRGDTASILEAAVAREPGGRSAAYADASEDLRRQLSTGAAMVKLYNELAKKSGLTEVNKFTDKATACHRLFSRMEESAESAPEAEPPAAEPEPEENAQMAKTKKTKPAEAGEKKTRARKFAGDAKITVLAEKNPKREGTKAHTRFGFYRSGMLVSTFLEKGGSYADLGYDVTHGHISVG